MVLWLIFERVLHKIVGRPGVAGQRPRVAAQRRNLVDDGTVQHLIG